MTVLIRVVQNWDASVYAGKGPNIPVPIRTFDGIPFPGVGCSCAPPDPNGAVGLTQIVQIVNEGYQVFERPQAIQFSDLIAFLPFGVVLAVSAKATEAAIPVVLYDHLANRWLISQFAGDQHDNGQVRSYFHDF